MNKNKEGETIMKFLTNKYLIINCKINDQNKILKIQVKNSYEASNSIIKELINKYNNIKIKSIHWEY